MQLGVPIVDKRCFIKQVGIVRRQREVAASDATCGVSDGYVLSGIILLPQVQS